MQRRFSRRHTSFAAAVMGSTFSFSAVAMAQTIDAIPEPAIEHRLLPGVIDIQPSYGHWGLEGWMLFLAPQSTTTPGVCRLPRPYVGNPNFQPRQQPRDEREIYDEGLWLPLEHPASMECSDARAPLLYVTNTSDNGLEEVGAMANAFRAFIASSRDFNWVGENVRCPPYVCEDMQRAVQSLTFGSLGNGYRIPPSSNGTPAGWVIDLRGAAPSAGFSARMPGKTIIQIPDEIGSGSKVQIKRVPG